jgi:hypothetical protein
MAFFICFLIFFLISSSATACDRCVHQTRAAYFSKASALSCKMQFFFFFFILLCSGLISHICLINARMIIHLGMEKVKLTQMIFLWNIKWVVVVVLWIWCSWGMWVWVLGIGLQQWKPCSWCSFPVQRWSWLWSMLSGTYLFPFVC